LSLKNWNFLDVLPPLPPQIIRNPIVSFVSNRNYAEYGSVGASLFANLLKSISTSRKNVIVLLIETKPKQYRDAVFKEP
jgi:hypothetical protein